MEGRERLVKKWIREKEKKTDKEMQEDRKRGERKEGRRKMLAKRSKGKK